MKDQNSVDRRDFIRTLGLGAASLAIAGPTACAVGSDSASPNVIFIMADDLSADMGEGNYVAGAHPEIVARNEEIMRSGRTESDLFPLRRNG